MKKISNLTKKIYFWFLKIKFKKLSKLSSNKKINIFGFDINIQDAISFYYEIQYIFKDEIYYFETKKENPLIIDGGSCLGTSIFYFKKIYPKSKIISFEPSLEVFNLLEKNVAENGLKDIRIINKGLYDSETELSFAINQVDSGKIDTVGDVKIKTTRLSNYIEEEIDFLKLNIEGSEYVVLKDLEENRKIDKIKEMCFEWHSFANQPQNLDKILEILNRNNFKYFISSLSSSTFGKFKAEKETEYFLMVYAKRYS